MKSLFLALVLLLAGCGLDARFYDQRVHISGWGFMLVSAYGQLIFGYVDYCRNAENCNPAPPVVPVIPGPNPAMNPESTYNTTTGVP